MTAGKATRKMTRRRLRGGDRTVDSPLRHENEGEKPTRSKGVAVDSAATSVSEELVMVGSKGSRSGATSKNSVVVVSSRRNSSEQPDRRKAETAPTVAAVAVRQTEAEAMADDDEDAGHSVDSSLQDESSMASVTDSQASSSDAGTSSKSKQKQNRPGGKTAAQPAKASRRRRSDEVPSFEGPATRRRSVRLRSGEKRRGTSPTELTPAKRARQKKPPAAAKKPGGRGNRGKVSNGEDESTTESQGTLDEEPRADRGEIMQDQSDTSMDVCSVEQLAIVSLEEKGSSSSSQVGLSGCEDSPASTVQEDAKEDTEPGTDQQAPLAIGAASALDSSSSVSAVKPEQKQDMSVEVCAESKHEEERLEEDASETCSTTCAESSTAPKLKTPQSDCPVAVAEADTAGASDLALAPDALPLSDSDERKEGDLIGGQYKTEVHENSTPLVAVVDTSSSVSEESNSVPGQASQLSDTKVTLQVSAGEALAADSEAATVPSHHLLSPTRSPQAVQMPGHRDRRYYSSPEKPGQADSPEKGSLTPRSSRRRTRWQDAEANAVSEPVLVPVADPSMSPVAIPVASAMLPDSVLPDWASNSSKPQEAMDAQDAVLPPPPPPETPSPQRKESLASLDSIRPEKVKSRWRRSSELETRDVAPAALAPRSPVARDSPPCGNRLSNIREEAPSSGKESPRKKDHSPPSAPPKECRESTRESNRESRGGGGGAGSREPSEPSGSSKSSRDADRTETSRDRGSSSGSNGSSTTKPLGYEDIEENLYLFERRKTKSKKEVRRMICDCSLTKDEKDRGIMGCEEDCLNRLLMIECGSRCPNGDNCSNRRFQKKTYIKVEKFMTEKKGWGLRTLETLSSGTFVMEYVGEVLTPEEFRKRVKQYARDNNQHYYFMALRSDEIIDATQKGNVSRFINHSCDPNCETQKWTVNGELRIGFFTRRPLRAGEELTFDYQFQRYGKEAQRCHCESSNCRGYIGEDTKMSLKSGRSLPPKRTSSSSSSSKRAEERKRDTVEDLAMEEEIEKLSGGLKNREHTLLLARLMVRGEDIDTRRRLLNIIRNTTETACLRLFLDYHGLSLLWSWMADIPDNELALKAEILTVLRQLPIPNKTMVKDSKVMSVVHRWASQLAEQGISVRTAASAGAAVESGTLPPSEKQPKVASEEADSDGSESSGSQTPASAPGQRSLTGSVVCSPDSTNLVENGDSTPSDGPKDESSGKMAKELSDLASTLLDSWSSLKEVFRIPRLEQQKRREDEREADRRERERNRQQKSRESSFSSRDSGSRRRSPPSSSNRDRRDRDHERSSDRRRYSASPERRDDRKSYHRSSDHRRSGTGSDSKPRKTLLPTPPKLSKEERRQLFALEVQQRDQEEALRRQFMVSPSPAQQPSIVVPAAPPPPQGFLGPPGMVPVQGGCPTAPMAGAPMVPGQPVPPLQQQQQAMYVYDPATAAAMYGTPPPQPAVAYYDPQTGAPIPPPQQPPPQQEYVLQHNAMLNGPPPVVAAPPGMQQPPAEMGGPHMLMQAPGVGPMVPPSQQPVMAPATTEEPHPQHHPLPPNIDYQALAAAISSVTNKPPSPVVVPPENAYFTDPMHIPLPPPLSPDSGDATPQNPDPVSSPTLDSTEEAAELLTPVQQQLDVIREPVGTTSLEVVPPSSYEAAVATPPVLPSPTQLPPPAAVAAPPVYSPVQQAPVPVPYAVVAGAPAGAPAIAAGTVYPPNPQPVATGYGPGYGPVGPTPAPGPVQGMHHPQVYYLPPIAQQAMPDEQSMAPVQSMEAPSGRMASPPPQTQAPSKKSGRLPPHWKTAKDEEGNIYYYHAQTRETQWDPPTWDENDQDMDLETPTYDEPKSKKKAVTVAADTSEVAKKIKELFRSKISSHIVHCLNPFRKPDCKLGRIQSTEDFKHLARKLTHFVMAKELKHCKNVEDLECNENVKHKAKEFIQKYMAKYGPVYRKDKAVSPKDE